MSTEVAKAKNTDVSVLAGDDDQAIHRWAGVNVKQFLDCSTNMMDSMGVERVDVDGAYIMNTAEIKRK